MTLPTFVMLASSRSRIPLEIALKGDKELLYGATSEDEGRGAEAVVLPFQSYGTLGRVSLTTHPTTYLLISDLDRHGKE